MLDFSGYYDTDIVGDAIFLPREEIPIFNQTVTAIVLETSATPDFSEDLYVWMDQFISAGDHKYCLDDFLNDDKFAPCEGATDTFSIYFDDEDEGYFAWIELEILERTDTFIRAIVNAEGAGGDDEELFSMRGTIYAIIESNSI